MPHESRVCAETKNDDNAFLRVFLPACANFADSAGPYCSGAILCRRFTRKSFENAIELRERLKPSRKRDLADAQIWVAKEITGICKPSARNILHEICAGYLLEIFTQVIG